jgi:hypothetical protein
VACADEIAGLTSKETKSHIREGLPTFVPKPTTDPDGEPAAPSAPAPVDPNLLVLPKLVVKEKRLPNDAADHLADPRAIKRKLENVYLDEVAAGGRLNYLLNCFTIPILSPSKAERGKALLIQREFDRLRDVSELPMELPAKK